MSLLRHRMSMAIVVLLGLVCARDATAGIGEHAFSLRTQYTQGTDHGLGYGLGYGYSIDDFWNLTLELDHGFAPIIPSDDTRQRVNGRIGVIYHIDAIQWIPHLIYTNGSYNTTTADGIEHAYGMQFGGGVDYRRWRSLALGVWADYHWIVVGNADGYFSAGLKFSLYTR